MEKLVALLVRQILIWALFIHLIVVVEQHAKTIYSLLATSHILLVCLCFANHAR